VIAEGAGGCHSLKEKIQPRCRWPYNSAMARSNLSFCLEHTPLIAEQLKALPPSSTDRLIMEAHIEILSIE
jgi:hypothetical protein